MKRVRFSKRKPVHHHNSALSAKVELRRWLVERLGGSPTVLDCFCAGGMLWERAYDKTERYLGLDMRQFNDARKTIVCDSRRFLRHVDTKLEDYDLFDLDAFGSPLEHLAIICNRLRIELGRKIGFVLTDGTGFNAAMNGTPKGLLHYVGISPHKKARVQLNYREEIFGMAITKALASACLEQVEARVAEKNKGARMRYLAILARKGSIPSAGGGLAQPAGISL